MRIVASSPVTLPREQEFSILRQKNTVPYPLPRNYVWKNDIEFNQALGELRGVLGIYIGLLATKYGLDIEDSLASILPESEEDQSSDT